MANPTADYPGNIHTPVDVPALAEQPLGATDPKHTEVHGKLEEEIVAIQEKLGIGPSDASSATAGQVLTKQSDGSTEWMDGSTARLPTAEYMFRASSSEAPDIQDVSFRHRGVSLQDTKSVHYPVVASQLEGTALIGMCKRTNGVDNGWFDVTTGYKFLWRGEVVPHYSVPINNAWTEIINSQADSSGILDYLEIAWIMQTDGTVHMGVDWGVSVDGAPATTWISEYVLGEWCDGIAVADWELDCSISGTTHTYTLKRNGSTLFTEVVTGKDPYVVPPAGQDLRFGSSECVAPLYSASLKKTDNTALYSYTAGSSSAYHYPGFGIIEAPNTRSFIHISPNPFGSFKTDEDFILGADESVSFILAAQLGLESGLLACNYDDLILALLTSQPLPGGFALACAASIGWVLQGILSDGTTTQSITTNITDPYDVLGGEHILEFQIDRVDGKWRVYLDEVVVGEDDLDPAFGEMNLGPVNVFSARAACYYQAVFKKKISDVERSLITKDAQR